MALNSRRLPSLRLGANPIIIKELRSRMRGPRAFMVLTAFLCLLAGVTYLLYRVVEQAAQYSGGPLSATIGQSMFAGLAFFELFLVAFITPALTAGTISGEHEALTYDMLVATPLPPASILWGKMIAAMSYVFLLIFAAIPLFSLVLIFGGVTIPDMLNALLVLVVCAITFGVVGIFYSALLNRTGRATVLSYLTLLAFILGPLFAYVFYGILYQQEPPRGILMPSPFTALASVLAPNPNGGYYGPLSAIFGLLSFGIGFVSNPDVVLRPMWHYTIGLYLLVSAILFMATMLLVRPIGRRRVSVRQLVMALLVFAVLGGGAALVYTPAELRDLFRSPVQLEPVPPVPMPDLP